MLTCFMLVLLAMFMVVVVSIYLLRAVAEQTVINFKTFKYSELVRVRPIQPSSSDAHMQIRPVIYKTGPMEVAELPQSLVDLFRATEATNPEYRIEYFSDMRCQMFVEAERPDMLRSYLSLVPGAFRTDVFRYCVLHKHGGVYSDLTQQFAVTLDELVGRSVDELVVVKDFSFNNRRCNWPGIQISFLAARSNLKVFEVALKMIKARVKARDYGCGALDVTGPRLFRRALEQSRQKYRLELEQTNDNFLVYMRPGDRAGEIAVRTKLPDHDAILGKTSANSYVEQYNRGIVYSGDAESY